MEPTVPMVAASSKCNFEKINDDIQMLVLRPRFRLYWAMQMDLCLLFCISSLTGIDGTWIDVFFRSIAWDSQQAQALFDAGHRLSMLEVTSAGKLETYVVNRRMSGCPFSRIDITTSYS